MAKKKQKFVCPKCGGELTMTTTIEQDINPDTGLVEDFPTVDRDIFCSECENEDLGDLDIIGINLAANKLK